MIVGGPADGLQVGVLTGVEVVGVEVGILTGLPVGIRVGEEEVGGVGRIVGGPVDGQ